MTTKTISTYISVGYTLSATYSAVTITATGGLGGVGLICNAVASVSNYGVVNGESTIANGVALNAGGSLTNFGGATITGVSDGVLATSGHVTNFGTIKGVDPVRFSSAASVGTIFNGSYANLDALLTGSVVYFAGGGTVTNLATIKSAITIKGVGLVANGSVADNTALITGATTESGAASTFNNFGTVFSGAITSVFLGLGGTVANGAATDTVARITGGQGVEIATAAGTVANFGTIQATTAAAADAGVILIAGGKVTNGSALDAGALIEGYNGVSVSGAYSTVQNFGTVLGQGTGGVEWGVKAAAGARVANGGSVDSTALIEGSGGVSLGAAGSVVNYGSILGAGGNAVDLLFGGVVTNLGLIHGAFDGVDLSGGVLINGAAADRTALITGYNGVVGGGAATIRNLATITGLGSDGVTMSSAGSVTNGSVNNSTALIAGLGGVDMYGSGLVTNFGTIWGMADTYSSYGLQGYGVGIDGGANLVNGAAGHTGAVIKGLAGVAALYEDNTVTNFGLIEGYGGVAVNFRGNLDTLVVEAGCAFVGAVFGGLGVLELANGAGTLTGLFAGGDVTVSGSMATTTFQEFDVLDIDGPASFVASGGGTIDASRSLGVLGTLTTAGVLSVAGGLAVQGTLGGTGTLAITGGAQSLNPGASLTIAKVTLATATVTVGAPLLTYAGQWSQKSGLLTVNAADRINFTGAGDSFAGTLGGAGTIGFTAGSDALNGVNLTASSVIIANAAVSLSGAITITGAVTATGTSLTIAAAGASFTGAGAFNLTNLATNALSAASAGATLTNVNDRITGAGSLGGGQMILVNQAGAVINANVSNALIIDTGANTVANAGIIESTATGGLTLKSAVSNTGSLTVTAGTLTLAGAVSGAGTVRIGGGAANVTAASFSENVTFTSTTGVLELANSQGYAGKISGFSKSGGTSLDLADIAFGGSTKATFSGTTASGVLTVTDGTHTARITLTGDYTASTFTVASDGHGGTSVTDPTAPAFHTPPRQPLIVAMAAFGAGASVDARIVDPPQIRFVPLMARASSA